MDDLDAILAPVERAARQLTNCDTCTEAQRRARQAAEAWRATNPERNER